MAERLLLTVPEHMREMIQPARKNRRAQTIAEMDNVTLWLIVHNMTSAVDDAPFWRAEMIDQTDEKALAECDLALAKNLELLAEAKLELINRGLCPNPPVAEPLAS